MANINLIRGAAIAAPKYLDAGQAIGAGIKQTMSGINFYYSDCLV